MPPEPTLIIPLFRKMSPPVAIPAFVFFAAFSAIAVELEFEVAIFPSTVRSLVNVAISIAPVVFIPEMVSSLLSTRETAPAFVTLTVAKSLFTLVNVTLPLPVFKVKVLPLTAVNLPASTVAVAVILLFDVVSVVVPT